jgi:peptidoglycan L-alanyl-D-glutamate endopeptidase CwlK
MSKLILQGVVPELQKLAGYVVTDAGHDNIEMVWTQGHRDGDYQDGLYEQGRSKPGKKVTWAKGKDAPHCHDAALDFAILVDGKANWNDDDELIDRLYHRVGEIGEAHGLEWGGRWPQPKTDKCHLQLKDWRKLPYHG